jgi:hypothetical protein
MSSYVVVWDLAESSVQMGGLQSLSLGILILGRCPVSLGYVK